MRRRYELADRGKRSQATYQTTPWRITLVGDEWGSIVNELPDVRGTKDRAQVMGAGALLGGLIARGRKVGIGMLIAAHDDTAAQFGLRGEMGLIGCFDYLVYLGAHATGNTSIPTAMRQAARRMSRPAVVLDTNRQTWALLTFDNLGAQSTSLPTSTTIPTDYAVVVRQAETEQDRLFAEPLGGIGKAPVQPQPRLRLRPEANFGAIDTSAPTAPAVVASEVSALPVADDPIVWTCPDNGLTATRLQVLALLGTDRTESDIVKTLWKIDATRGARYKAAQAVVAQIRAAALAKVIQAV